MGSYSELYFSDVMTKPGEGELSETAPYLLSRYHLPLLWLALYRRENLTEVPEPSEPANLWPYLVAPRTEALATLAARRELLVLHFPSMKPLWFDQFTAMLEQTPFAFVHLDTMDIGSVLYAAPQWRQVLEALLGIFETDAFQAEAGWQQFHAGYSGPYEGESATKPWTYCGGGGAGSSMPWDPPE